jgi:hypothetical protein
MPDTRADLERPMKIRLRGDVKADLDWTEFTTPTKGDLFQHNSSWYRVEEAMWGAVTKGGEIHGWDCGLILRRLAEPPDMQPAPGITPDTADVRTAAEAVLGG